MRLAVRIPGSLALHPFSTLVAKVDVSWKGNGLEQAVAIKQMRCKSCLAVGRELAFVPPTHAIAAAFDMLRDMVGDTGRLTRAERISTARSPASGLVNGLQRWRKVRNLAPRFALQNILHASEEMTVGSGFWESA